MKTRVRSDWAGALIACSKCSRKLRGGFGPKGRDTLARALRDASGGGRKRKAPLGVVEVKCLGVCPKRAAVLVDAADPHRWHLIPAGRDAGEVLAELGYGKEDVPGESTTSPPFAPSEVEGPGRA